MILLKVEPCACLLGMPKKPYYGTAIHVVEC